MTHLTLALLVVATLLVNSQPAAAYLDPGVLGPLQQFGLMIVYGITSIFLFFFRPIKRFFLGLFRRKPAPSVEAETGSEEEAAAEEE